MSKANIALDENSMTSEIIQQEEELAILRHDLKNIVSSIDFYADSNDFESIKVNNSGDTGTGGILIARLQDVYQLDAILNQKIF
ncbi:MAG: hypothetical protein ACLUCE_09570 [Streptococcus sp.]|uniref:hypothetical protein n=1 Tax=Streptococcus sp. TaxID=1306 RepID=UPI0039923561